MAKTNQEIMEILEAFDLTRSYRAAAQLAGTDHETVAHYVERARHHWALDAACKWGEAQPSVRMNAKTVVIGRHEVNPGEVGETGPRKR